MLDKFGAHYIIASCLTKTGDKKMQYLLTSKDNYNSYCDGVIIDAKDLSAAKRKASRMRGGRVLVLTHVPKTYAAGDKISFQDSLEWHDICYKKNGIWEYLDPHDRRFEAYQKRQKKLAKY